MDRHKVISPFSLVNLLSFVYLLYFLSYSRLTHCAPWMSTCSFMLARTPLPRDTCLLLLTHFHCTTCPLPWYNTVCMMNGTGDDYHHEFVHVQCH